MKKRVLSLILVLCAMLALLTACKKEEESKSEPISTSQAVQIVLDELDIAVEQANPHAHTGSYQGEQCYIVYVTVNDSNLAYFVHSITGEILGVEESNHHH